MPLEPGMRLPEPASRFVPRRELENLSIGLGRGQTAAMEGTRQLLTQPIATAQALIEAARQLGADPRIVLDMLRAARQKAMSGSLGLGELIGENVTPTMRGRGAPVARITEPASAVEVPDVLHGSPMRGLTNLSPSKSMEVRGATWFSDNPDVADQYTFPREYGEILYDAEPGEVYKAALSFKNPMTVDMKGKVGDARELSKLVKKAKEEGYDGLILRNVDDSIDSSNLLGTSYAVFDPSQIKLKKK